MLSSTDSINTPGRNHQPSTIRTQNPSNGKPSKAVVLHHPLMSPPPEDWVLFPDQVIHSKHSTVRDSRARPAKKRLHPAGQSSRSSSANTTEMSRATSTSSRNTSISSCTEEPFDERNSSSKLDRSENITKTISNDEVAEEGPRNPPKVKVPQRLPTPDLSDLDENGFWSCCGSTERNL